MLGDAYEVLHYEVMNNSLSSSPNNAHYAMYVKGEGSQLGFMTTASHNVTKYVQEVDFGVQRADRVIFEFIIEDDYYEKGRLMNLPDGVLNKIGDKYYARTGEVVANERRSNSQWKKSLAEAVCTHEIVLNGQQYANTYKNNASFDLELPRGLYN